MTPIYSALIEYVQENNIRLHMPGHIGGKGIGARELELIARIDFTEIPGLDDLHMSQGIIEEARQLMGKAFGADESLFLVNGATSGIHALFMSVTGDGDKVMIPRNAHRSFYGAMVLSGAQPVYIPCEIEPELGIAVAVRAENVERLLASSPDIKTIFVTSPSYYGTCCDIADIVNVTRKWGKHLLVDEAHGAHFAFHTSYPVPAIQDGAAGVVNGLHKTLPVLNQGACLHLSKDFMDRDQLFSAYHILTTTSPSYPILASIDLARCFMEEKGTILLERAVAFSQEFSIKIAGIKGVKICADSLTNLPGVKAIDPLKILVSVQGLSLTGYQVAGLLRDKYNIQVELADNNVILAMFSLLHEREAWDRFYRALSELACTYILGSKKSNTISTPPYSQPVLSPRQAFMARKRKVKLQDSVGAIAGEMVAAYPPGIPCLVPGELITGEILDYILELKIEKNHIQGPEDPYVEYIKVIEKWD